MKQGSVTKRSIVIRRQKTSVSLEDPFWKGLKEIVKAKESTLSAVVSDIDEKRAGNLSSAIRVFVYEHARGQQAAGASV